MSSRPLAGKVALVTGATRGVGKGIAVQLGQAGALVYITGRTLNKTSDSVFANSLTETANEIEERGGQCIPIRCDHSNDKDVEEVFDRIKKEQDGQLDLLVNNVYAGVVSVIDGNSKQFWDLPPTIWDDINGVGLRNHYLCTVYAARLMVPRSSGLIVNISSAGGMVYLFSPAYGIGKAACDRMAVDCAIELRKHNVAMVSLWPGPVRTETIQRNVLDSKLEIKDARSARIRKLFEDGETPEYSGKCVVGLMQDSEILKRSGRVLLTGDLGSEFGFLDIDGRVPSHVRALNYITEQYTATRWMSRWIPNFIRIPKWFMALKASKF